MAGQNVTGTSAAQAAGRAASTAAAAVALASAATSPRPGERETTAPVQSIADPGSGVRWLVVRDPLHPGGPGRLVRVPLCTVQALCGPALRLVPAPDNAVIRVGDPLLVEEHNATADVLLHAVALQPGIEGKLLRARITPGSIIITVIASAPGRARLAPQSEVKP
jgi:hypothetical protein